MCVCESSEVRKEIPRSLLLAYMSEHEVLCNSHTYTDSDRQAQAQAQTQTQTQAHTGRHRQTQIDTRYTDIERDRKIETHRQRDSELSVPLINDFSVEQVLKCSLFFWHHF